MKRKRRILSMIMAIAILVTAFLYTGGEVEAATAVPKITYQAHSQDVGWMSTVKNGATAGTTGQSRRLEALKINLKDGKKSAISYRAHVRNVGWQGWKSSGAVAGTTGKSLQIEAVQIKLTGNYAKLYDVYYRVHVAAAGWLAWTKNGATAGSTGSAIRVEAIQVKLVKKGAKVSGTGLADITKTKLTYQAHTQNIGWMNAVAEDTVAGTTGQSRRLEALKINLKDFNGGNAIRYSAHVAQIGWQDWKTTGQIAGTTGRGLAIEAIKIQLTGSMAKYYDVYYRMHVAGYGWLGWAKNGAVAGTTGGGVQAEGIQIKLVAKSVSFDAGGAAYIDASMTMADKVIQIAKGELGYHGKSSNENLYVKSAWNNKTDGNAPYNKYSLEMAGSVCDHYCVDFVNWCFRNAGVNSSQYTSSIRGCYTYENWYAQRGQWHNVGSYTPKKGDLIFYTYGHVGFVTGVGNGEIYTLEGNTINGNGEQAVVAERVVSYYGSSVDGFVSINY